MTEDPTLEGVLDRIGRQRPEGLLVMAEPSLIGQGGKITAFASTLGLVIPQTLPLRADQVIE
jgi:hypothetical protein